MSFRFRLQYLLIEEIIVFPDPQPRRVGINLILLDSGELFECHAHDNCFTELSHFSVSVFVAFSSETLEW